VSQTSSTVAISVGARTGGEAIDAPGRCPVALRSPAALNGHLELLGG
jgi:hypothetical protein